MDLETWYIQGWVKSFAIFWYVLSYGTYITWLKQFKLWKKPTVVSSIVVVGALTCCVLPHSVSDLTATQMNIQHSLILELMFYKFELSHKTTEATKSICCTKDEGVLYYRTITRWLNPYKKQQKSFTNIHDTI